MRALALLLALAACHTTTTSTMPRPRPAPGPEAAPPGAGWTCADDGTCTRDGDVASAFCYLDPQDRAACFATIDACAQAMQATYEATMHGDVQVTECAEWR